MSIPSAAKETQQRKVVDVYGWKKSGNCRYGPML